VEVEDWYYSIAQTDEQTAALLSQDSSPASPSSTDRDSDQNTVSLLLSGSSHSVPTSTDVLIDDHVGLSEFMDGKITR
jgi:hypothetical protein